MGGLVCRVYAAIELLCYKTQTLASLHIASFNTRIVLSKLKRRVLVT